MRIEDEMTAVIRAVGVTIVLSLTSMIAGCSDGNSSLVRPVESAAAAFPSWYPEPRPGRAPADLHALWVSAGGEEAWAAGAAGAILHHRGEAWHEDSVNAPPDITWRALSFSGDGRMGFAVGSSGWVATYSGGHRWSALQVAPDADTLTSVWADPSGRDAYAVGLPAVALHWSAAGWQRIELQGVTPASRLLDVAGTEKELWVQDSITVAAFDRTGLRRLREFPYFAASEIWTQGTEQRIWIAGVTHPPPAASGKQRYPLRNQHYTIRWYQSEAADSTSGIPFLPEAAWMGANQRCAVAAGTILYAKERTPSSAHITRDGAFSWPHADSADIRAVWTNAACTDGWAAGSKGPARLRQRRLTIKGMTEEYGQLSKLSGKYLLELDSGVPRPTVNSLRLISSSDTVLLLAGAHVLVDSMSAREFSIEITDAGRRKAASMKDQSVRLQFLTSYPGSLPAYPVVYERAESFTYDARSFWSKIPGWVWGVLLFLLIVATFIWAVPRFEFARLLLFTPTGREILGGVRGGFLPSFVSFLLMIWPRFRHSLFGDYRREFQSRHNPPTDFAGHVVAEPGLDGVQATVPGEPAWKSIFEHVRRKRGGVVLVEAPASELGLHFLEAWAGLALSRGHTPVLLNLRDGVKPEDEVRRLWGAYGKIPEGVPPLWQHGGFVFLLNGWNEHEANPIEPFIEDVRASNTVVYLTRNPRAIPGAHQVRVEQAITVR